MSTPYLRTTLATNVRVPHNVLTLDVERQRRTYTLFPVMDELDYAERKRRLAYAIRAARERRKMTPPELAQELHVGRGAVNKWESGESAPSLLMLGPLCKALKVDANLFAVLPPIPAWDGEAYLMDEVSAMHDRVSELEQSRRQRGAAGRKAGRPSQDGEPGTAG